LAVRIVFRTRYDIEEKNQAWMVYSAVTSHYRPHPERIRDWISTPKANGYEALHVTVMGPEGLWIEVQIRSERMHEIAEKGLSAHWKYKEGEQSSETELDNWLKNIKEILENPEPSALDFLDTFKLNLFATEIFVFTPKGEIKTMPQGSTALDFAFFLHSDLGFQCIGAKVNHKLEPLSHVLNSGDQVEILTSKKQTPQPEWINFVTTARGQSKLKDIFKKETRTYNNKGKQLLEEYFQKMEMIIDDESIDMLLKYFKLAEKQDLYFELGREVINLDEVEEKVFRQKTGLKWRNYWKLQFASSKKNEPQVDVEDVDEETQKASSNQKIDRKKTLKLTDDNKDDIYIIAACCNPIPGDDILGYVDNDELVTLHKRQCPVADKLKSSSGERIVSVEWTSKKILTFPALLEVKGIDAQGILIQIIKVISEEYQVNIQKIKLESVDGIFEGLFQVNVHNTEHVSDLCAHILKIKAVSSVNRLDLETKED
jgi:guanosine-3',5'-bis(diphosphate) 3'-pyrophosphohydrolase